MVHNFDTPLTQEHAIEEIAKDSHSSKNEANYKRRKSSNEEKINVTSSVETAQTTNIISEDKFLIERILETTVEAGAHSTHPIIYTKDTASKREESESRHRNKKPARAYRHLRGMSRLEETSFWMKTELTADYQGSTLLSVSNEHYGSANNIIKTTVDTETVINPADGNEEGET